MLCCAPPHNFSWSCLLQGFYQGKEILSHVCYPEPPLSWHFADVSKGDDLLSAGTEDYIHIRVQQRSDRKTLTTVQGIADDYHKELVKAFKKKSACNYTVTERPEYGDVIQLQDDQLKNTRCFLIEIGLAKVNQLKVRGF